MYALYKPKRDIAMHAFYMRQALVIGCLVPALMRIPDMTGIDLGENWPGYAFIFAFPVYFLHERAEKRKKWY